MQNSRGQGKKKKKKEVENLAFQPWEHLYKSASAKNCKVVMWSQERVLVMDTNLERSCISGRDLLDHRLVCYTSDVIVC